MEGNLGIAISSFGNKVVLVSVENEGFAVEEYPCTEFGVNDLEGCFSFCFGDQLFFCVRKSIFQFIPKKNKWVKLSQRMEVARFGTACVALKKGVVIAGGSESDGKGVPELTDSCVLVTIQKGKFITNELGKLPMKVRYHTMTKITDNKFILCGGMNLKGHELQEVYLGTLVSPATEPLGHGRYYGNDEVYVSWAKLPNMWEWRSNHFTMFVNNRLYVFGGGPKRTEKQHLNELNLKYCGFDMGLFAGSKAECLPLRMEDDKLYFGKWQPLYDMGYDISFANLVLSPDKKYGVIAGGEVFTVGEKMDSSIYFTMNTRNMRVRALGEKIPYDDDDSLHTNNILKIILSCSCFTPMYDD